MQGLFSPTSGNHRPSEWIDGHFPASLAASVLFHVFLLTLGSGHLVQPPDVKAQDSGGTGSKLQVSIRPNAPVTPRPPKPKIISPEKPLPVHERLEQGSVHSGVYQPPQLAESVDIGIDNDVEVGAITLILSIDEHGMPTYLEVVSSQVPSEVEASIVSRFFHAKYYPAMIDDKPAPGQITIEVKMNPPMEKLPEGSTENSGDGEQGGISGEKGVPAETP